MAEPAPVAETLRPIAPVSLQVLAPLGAEPAAPAPPDPPSSRFEIPRYDLSGALALEHELGISHVLAQVLVRRGLADPDAARDFLEARELHPPAAFRGIESAVSAIQRRIADGGRITIHGDYDVDGVCATAVLVRGLKMLVGDRLRQGPLLSQLVDVELSRDHLAAAAEALAITSTPAALARVRLSKESSFFDQCVGA